MALAKPRPCAQKRKPPEWIDQSIDRAGAGAGGAARAHGDDDDAGLGDDGLGELVEGGVRVVREGLQLLLGVVQLQDGAQRAAGAPDHRRRQELHHAVVLAQGLLRKLIFFKKQKKSQHILMSCGQDRRLVGEDKDAGSGDAHLNSGVVRREVISGGQHLQSGPLD